MTSDEITQEGEGHGRGIVRGTLTWWILEVQWILRVLLSSADRFYWSNGFSKAASLAYTSLLSLFPVTALLFTIVGSFVPSSTVLIDPATGAAASQVDVEQVRQFLFGQFVPNTQVVSLILEYLKEFSDKVSSASLNFVMLGFLVVTSILLINSIEYTLNEVWQVFESRSITDRITIFCSILLIAPILLFSGYYFTKLRLEPLIHSLSGGGGMTLKAYTFLLPFLIDFIAFASLYYLVPKAPVRVRPVVFGAFVASLLFGLAKAGFAVYVERFASYDKLYGAIAAIPIFLIWMYLGWITVLLGAEACYQAQYLPRTGKIWKRSVMSVGDASLMLAVQALVMITKAFNQGKPPPNVLQLAESLGCSTVVLKPALYALQHKHILARGEGRDTPITLLRAPNTVTIEEIMVALFPDRKSIRYTGELVALFESFETARDRSRITLQDLLEIGERQEGKSNG